MTLRSAVEGNHVSFPKVLENKTGGTIVTRFSKQQIITLYQITMEDVIILGTTGSEDNDLFHSNLI